MPQVPYSGAPSVEPSATPIPRVQASASGEAFGSSVAQATSNLGKTIENSGDELFKRALDMQNLYNQSQALEADTRFTEAAGEIHAKLNSLQGKNAVDYFQTGYKDDLKGSLRSIRDSLPNDMARKMFDQSAKGTYGRNVFNAAGFAATQSKNYAIGTATARVQASRNEALANPADEESFAAQLQITQQNVEYAGGLKGLSAEAIANETRKATSDLWYDRISSLSKEQPFTASKMLDKAAKDNLISGEDLGKITNEVRTAMRTVGARNVSNEVRSGDGLSFGSNIVSPTQARNAIGTYESGNNYEALGVEVFDKKTGASRGRALGKYQVMPENLPGWLKEAGLPSMTPREFLSNPKAQDQVFDTVFGRYMQTHGTFNDAASMWFSGQPVAKAGDVTDANKTSVPEYLRQTNAILAKGATLNEQTAVGKARATMLAPNDPLFGDYVEQRIVSDHNRQIAIQRDDTYRNRQTVEAGIIGGASDGKLPTTVDELRELSPELDASWTALPASEQRRYMAILARNSKQDTTWDAAGVKLREYQRMKGMAQSDPATFLDQDVISLDVPNSARRELVNLQIKMKDKAEADPRVTRAMQTLGPTLQAANILKDKDALYTFKGALQGALEQYQEENKKAPDAKAVQEIGQRLLQEQSGTGYFGTNIGAEKLFQITVPEDQKKIILADPFWATRGIVPTDDQINRIYQRQMYNKLYGGKPKVAKP